MAIANLPSSDIHGNHASRPTLSTTAYDKVSGLLIALLGIVGVCVFALFVIWLSTQLVFTPRAVAVTLVEEDPGGRGDHAAGTAEDLEAPSQEEMPEVAEPPVATMLEQVSNVVSTNAAVLDAIDVDSVVVGKGGTGQGDSRPPGPLGRGKGDQIPRWERWVIRFNSTNAKVYAAQLDFFGIELGAVDVSSPAIDYVKDLSKSRPTRRTGTRDEENKVDRVFFNWKEGSLQELDRSLMSKGGVNVQNRLVYHFYSKNTENTLAVAEQAYAKNRPIREIRRTVFSVKETRGGGYEFQVTEQTYRVPPPQR